MAQPRRMAVDGARTRTLFVDAAEAILREEGYVGISARQIASRAGLKTQLIYYYFKSIDDVIIAVVRRVNDHRLKRLEEALAAPEPLRALWRLNGEASGAALSAELTSLAGRREAIRDEIVRSARTFRALQVEAVSRLLQRDDAGPYPSAGLVMIAVALARTVVTESALGLTDGHEEALALVERFLEQASGARTGPAQPKTEACTHH